MKNLKLSTKTLLASVFVLIIFCFASVTILFQAQSHQAYLELDQSLSHETLALSTLVNSSKDGKLDFEISPLFLSQYKQRNPNGFFRFIEASSGVVLKESPDSPHVGCSSNSVKESILEGGVSYRIQTLQFQPELDGEIKTSRENKVPSICLVAGIDEAPYKAMIHHTLVLTIPILVSIFVILIGFLLVLIRGMTRDLSLLTHSLTTEAFGASQSFPTLPLATTPEVKAVIEKLEALHSQAAKAYREMWLFLGRAAHQIKTPVTAMQTTLDVLLRKERSKEELLLGLEDVKSASLLLSTLTQKLILSSRISYQEVPDKEAIELKKFFFELVNLFRLTAIEKSIQIAVMTEKPLEIIGNLSLLSDIFGNLLENAILYSASGKVSTIRISWLAKEKFAEIEILDEGSGFPKEVIATLFEPFVRGNEQLVSGSGLGLSIVKKSVRLLNGEIELRESTLSGSKVIVTLPLA